MKLKKKAKIILVIIVALIILGLIYFLFMNNDTKKVKESKVVSEIPKYGYQLNDHKSKAYKELFQELKKVLEKDTVDEEKYASLVTEMFILDFYTLDDKITKSDVGGVDFVHADAKSDFQEKAMDTIYKYVESDLYGERKQQLPEVKNVVVGKIETVSFDYNDETDEQAYQIEVKWGYKKDMGYQTEATLILVHEGIKLSVVEMD